jgi:hypothetical protein
MAPLSGTVCRSIASDKNSSLSGISFFFEDMESYLFSDAKNIHLCNACGGNNVF